MSGDQVFMALGVGFWVSMFVLAVFTEKGRKK